MSETQRPSRRLTRDHRAALSTGLAALILALVVVISGAGTYAIFSQTGPSSTCFPANSPLCPSNANPHDLTVLAPVQSSAQGAIVPFTAILPAGETSSDFSFDFGDGSFQNHSSASTVTHAYAFPGAYLVSVVAIVGGVAHDNYHALRSIAVSTSYGSNTAGIYPTVSGQVVSNTTTSSSATGVLRLGQSVVVHGAYTFPPTNPSYALGAPKLIASKGVAPTSPVVTSTSAQGTFTFSSPGSYQVSFVGTSVNTTGGIVYQNYTWSVRVAPSGQNYALPPTAPLRSPHPGSLVAYEDVNGGGISFDPAIDYDVAAFETLLNVYQTLIQANGTQAGPLPSDYVAALATCVPGSAQCGALYGGNTLVQGDNYTFVIDGAARFYDPGTGVSWGVYPSDVVFSLMRTMGFAEYPATAVTPGWIQTQALLPGGNGSWDSGLHTPFNNTPQNIFASMSVNASAWCPAVAMQTDHGCVTFHANASNSYGSAWPFFLELISDVEGAGIVSCGWYSLPAQGQGIPGWTLTNGSDQGDHPCVMPTPAQISVMSPISLDAWESGYISGTGGYSGHTQWAMVGSGPYYLENTQIHESYTLRANPAYTANPYCTWVTCEPPAGKYAANVSVVWEPDPSTGEQALASGVADIASIPSTDTALLLELSQQGKVGSVIVPTLALYVLLFALEFSSSREHVYTGATVNIPSDWMSHLGVRQFLTHAYPYSQIQSLVNTRDGIQYGFDVGGSIPQFMANYYPNNIGWPNGTPDANPSDVGGAAWWWAQLTTNTSSPDYNAWTATHCLAASPCEFPMYGSLGSPDEDLRLSLFTQSVTTLTGGALKPYFVDISATNLYNEGLTTGGPGTDALPMQTSDWYPDYPDPSDYTGPFYTPDSTFTYPEGTAEGIGSSLYGPSPYNTTLPGGGPCPTDYNYWVNNSVPESCQGAAYDAMVVLLTKAGPLPSDAQRLLEFDQSEKIANKLAIMIDEYQLNLVDTYGAWVDGPSLLTNVIDAGDFFWYFATGAGVQYRGST